MELREFKTLVRQLANNFDNMLVIEALFYKLDLNGDFTVSLKEFKLKIIDKIDQLSDEESQLSSINQNKLTSLVV